MTEMPVFPPEIQAAITSVYQQGLETGRRLGYEEGIKAARALLMTLSTTMPGEENASVLLNTPIEQLDFTARTYACLKREGMSTLGDILERSEAQLFDIRNFGSKSVDEVKAKLTRLGFHLRPGSPADPRL